LITIRSQAIDGAGTYTPRDSQPGQQLQRNQDIVPSDKRASGVLRTGVVPGQRKSISISI
jgi:hypothetical protein